MPLWSQKGVQEAACSRLRTDGVGQVGAHGLVVPQVSDMEAVLLISKCFTNSPHRYLHASEMAEGSEEPSRISSVSAAACPSLYGSVMEPGSAGSTGWWFLCCSTAFASRQTCPLFLFLSSLCSGKDPSFSFRLQGQERRGPPQSCFCRNSRPRSWQPLFPAPL